jgi:hypothetical protein
MSGNVACIGIKVADREEFSRVLGRLAGSAVDEFAPRPDERHRRWTDPSGAAIVFHCGADGVDCITPFFVPKAGAAVWRVRSSRPAVDPECAHCSGADCDVLDAAGELVTRATVQWLNFLPYREWLGRERTYDLEVAAFARAARFCADLAEFDEAQKAWWGDGKSEPGKRETRLAAESFLPTGMFEPAGGPLSRRATALVCGRVESAETLENAATHVRFRHAVVRSIFGRVDVVAPDDGNAPPAAGAIALIQAWLVGRPVPLP